MTVDLNTLRFKRKTGYDWDEWVTMLDHCGYSQVDDITSYLRLRHNLDPHWAQFIAMRYYLRLLQKQTGELSS